MKRIAVIVALLLLATTADAQRGGRQKGPEVGKKAPEISGPDTDGVKFKLSDYKGKVVLLDFWGNW